MKYIFPINSSATNVLMLISITLSYLCFPVGAFILTHTVCDLIPAITTYWQQFSASTVFLLVSIYSFFGILCMYISFFRKRSKKRK